MKLLTKTLALSALALGLNAVSFADTNTTPATNPAPTATATAAEKAPSQQEVNQYIHDYTLVALDQLQKTFNFSKEELEAFAQAAKEYATGNADLSKISNEQRQKIAQYMGKRANDVRVNAEKEQAKKNEELGKTAVKNFLAKPNVVSDKSGIYYVIEKQGTGKPITLKDTVEVFYTGKLADGTVFDTNLNGDKPTPTAFPLNSIIKGFQEAVTKLKVGGKIDVLIPPTLAYGQQGVPGVIPPNSYLEFEIEVVKVSPNAENGNKK